MIDFYGSSGCGKTLYLYAIIISTILPRSWKYSKSKPAVLLNGKARSVIFLDLEQGFSADQLKSLLYLEIMARLGLYEQSENAKVKNKEADREGVSGTNDTGNKEDSSSGGSGYDSSTNNQPGIPEGQEDFFIDTQSPEMKAKIEQLMASCLRNVHIFRPQDAISAIVVLRTLDQYMTSNSMSSSTSKPFPPFAILIIDSVSSFYWQERATNSHNRSITMLIDALNRLVPRWKLIFISTTWLLPSKSSTTDRTITDALRARFKYRFLMQPRTLEKFDSQDSLVQEWIRRQRIKHQQKKQQQDSSVASENRDEYPGSVFQAQMLIPSAEHSQPEYFRFSISDAAGVCSFSVPL
ncbi:hypothetical protein BGZ76_002607 [Entomortierella beljakovae]|nr:hypothetical protein BGZ76_002607 [Entomortierella beljakovae]